MKMVSLKSLGLFAIVCLFIFLSVGQVFACTTIIVGKNRTDDGSVLVAHSEEDGNNDAQQLIAVPRQKHQTGDVYLTYAGGKIPQPAETYAYNATKIFDKNYNPGDFITGVNEFQVTVANNMAWTKEVPEATAWDPPIRGGVIWTEFIQLVLERAKTAKEGVQIIGMLCEKYHLSSDPGTMFAVADPNEGWWVEVTRDGQWIAQRVPDNAAEMRANSYRIGAVDLNDSRNIMHSPNLVQYAIEKGWYNPQKIKPFNFAVVYGETSFQNDKYNTLRHQMVNDQLSKGKISKEKLMNIMRSVYEGTPAYKADEKTGSPFRTGVRTVSRINTIVSSVVQLRGWLPADIGAVTWWNMATSKTGVYIPWYFGTKEFSKPYIQGTSQFSDDSAYWAFAELAELTDAHYKDVIGMVTNTWGPFEANELILQKSLEEQAVLMYKKNPDSACQFLTWYSNALGDRSFQLAKQLGRDIKSKIYNEQE